MNTPRPVVAGGTGASSASAALVNLGLTATAAEINVLDGVTASTAELNTLDGVTASAAELNILDGATLSTTELNYVDGVTSAIQTQLDAKQALNTNLTKLAALVDPGELRVLAWIETANEFGYIEVPGRLLLQSVTASASATMDFTFFDNAIYRYYEFELENVKPTTDGADLYVRTSTDGGSTYDAGASDYGSAGIVYAAGGAVTGLGSGAATHIPLNPSAAGLGNAAGERGMTGTLKLSNAGLAAQARILFNGMYDNQSNAMVWVSSGGHRVADQDTTALRFLMSSGTIASGTIRMYGLI